MIISIFLLCMSFLAHAYEVGTAVYHVVDSSRKEIYNHHNQQQPRELVLQVWYPAASSGAHQMASYLGKTSSFIKKNMSIGWNKPEKDFDYLDALQSHSILNAPLSCKRNMYPLLIFSPGFGTPYHLYTSYFESLAQQDYIVVAISHTYNCNPTVFPDGRIIEQDESFKNFQSDALQELQTWVADIRFVIDQMELFNTSANHPLSGKINMYNIGIFGHSFGGAAAMHACQLDQRIRACVNMDGKLWGANLEGAITVPLMTLLSDTEINPHAKETRQCAFQIMNHAQNDTYCFMINNANHYTFSDDTILTNYQNGTVDAQELVVFLPKLIGSFFSTYLHHRDNQVFGAIIQYQHWIKQYFINIGQG